MPVTICLGDITGCTPPFLLIEFIILTVDITNSLISLVGIRLILLGNIDRTHLTLSFTNLIVLSMNGTCEFVSQHNRVIPCSFNTSLQASNARSAYIVLTINPQIMYSALNLLMVERKISTVLFGVPKH